MAKASEIIASIRNRLADQVDKAYDDGLLIDFINDGASEFAATTGCMQASTAVTLTEGQKEINLSGLAYTWTNVYKVEYKGVELDFCPQFETKGWSDDSPSAYTVWDKTVILNGPAAEGEEVKVYYTRVPAAIVSSDDTFDFPLQWQPAIKAYAEFRCRAADRESGLGDRAYAEYGALRESAALINQAFLGGGYAK